MMKLTNTLLKNILLKSVFFFFLSSIIGFSVFAQQNSQVQIFLLNNPAKNINCTATLFKPNSATCSLVTNAHCIGADTKQVSITETYHSIPSFNLQRKAVKNKDQTYTVDVLKTSNAMDLSELSIPQDLKSSYCSHSGLEPVKALSMVETQQSQKGLISTGFNNEIIYFTQSGLYQLGVQETGPVGWPHIGYSRRSVYKTYISDLPLVIKINDLKVYRGMSGGAVIDQDLNLVGVNIWVRDQGIQQSFFIPTFEIINFLNKPKIGLDQSIKNNKSIEAGGNGHADVGGNGHADGGGNGHGDGGLESSLHASLKKEVKLDEVNNLKDFFMPDEGIADPSNSDYRILGINGQSIDGLDDYTRVTENKKIRTIIKKTKGIASYLDQNIREKFLERIGGNYTSKAFGRFSVNDHDSDITTGRYSVYFPVQNTDYFERNQSVVGEPVINLNINSRSEIEIQIDRFYVRSKRATSLTDPVVYAKQNFKFSSKMINEGQQISLELNHGRSASELICENTNYMKINCSNKSMTLSFHKYNEDRVEFIFTAFDETHKIIQHYYGDLGQIKP